MSHEGCIDKSGTSARFYKGVLVYLNEEGKRRLPRYAHLVGEVCSRPIGATVRVWWGLTSWNSSEYYPKEWFNIYSTVAHSHQG